jgi:hypothetical protein
MLSYSSTIQTDLKVYNSVFITDHPLYASTIAVGNANVIPVAYPDAYNVDQNGVLTTTVENGVLSNDIDTDNLITAELVSNVSNGTLILNADGSFTYTPNENYYGQDSFTYRVFDRKAYSNIETVIITVNQVITWNELIADIYEDRVIADGGTVLDKPQLITDLDTIGEANYNNLTFLMNPNGGSKTGKIHTIKPEDGTADLTVDRNCEASYIAEDGSFQFANANEPRFDWSSGKSTLLREGQSTNLFTYSESFNNWSKESNTSVLENQAIGLDGLVSADKLVADTERTSGSARGLHVTTSKNTDTTYTHSIYVKKGNIDWFYMRAVASAGSSPNPYSWFNINDGTLGMTQGGLIAKITQEKDGWFKCSITFTTASSIGLNREDIGITSYNGNFNVADAGSYVYIYGAQLEEGSTATSYIKTEGSTKTRLKDTITVAPPVGTTQIIETIDGVEQTPITSIPTSYQVSEGNINQIKML